MATVMERPDHCLCTGVGCGGCNPQLFEDEDGYATWRTEFSDKNRLGMCFSQAGKSFEGRCNWCHKFSIRCSSGRRAPPPLWGQENPQDGEVIHYPERPLAPECPPPPGRAPATPPGLPAPKPPPPELRDLPLSAPKPPPAKNPPPAAVGKPRPPQYPPGRLQQDAQPSLWSLRDVSEKLDKVIRNQEVVPQPSLRDVSEKLDKVIQNQESLHQQVTQIFLHVVPHAKVCPLPYPRAAFAKSSSHDTGASTSSSSSHGAAPAEDPPPEDPAPAADPAVVPATAEDPEVVPARTGLVMTLVNPKRDRLEEVD